MIKVILAFISFGFLTISAVEKASKNNANSKFSNIFNKKGCKRLYEETLLPLDFYIEALKEINSNISNRPAILFRSGTISDVHNAVERKRRQMKLFEKENKKGTRHVKILEEPAILLGNSTISDVHQSFNKTCEKKLLSQKNTESDILDENPIPLKYNETLESNDFRNVNEMPKSSEDESGPVPPAKKVKKNESSGNVEKPDKIAKKGKKQNRVKNQKSEILNIFQQKQYDLENSTIWCEMEKNIPREKSKKPQKSLTKMLKNFLHSDLSDLAFDVQNLKLEMKDHILISNVRSIASNLGYVIMNIRQLAEEEEKSQKFSSNIKKPAELKEENSEFTSEENRERKELIEIKKGLIRLHLNNITRNLIDLKLSMNADCPILRVCSMISKLNDLNSILNSVLQVKEDVEH